MPPLCPEANGSNRARPLPGQAHLDNDQFHQRRHCCNLPLLIPIGKPRLRDISHQHARATIHLPHQPQNPVVIPAAVVSDTILNGHIGSCWNRLSQGLRHRKHMPLPITSQSEPSQRSIQQTATVFLLSHPRPSSTGKAVWPIPTAAVTGVERPCRFAENSADS